MDRQLCLKGVSVGGQDVMYGQTVVLSEGHICGGSGCNVWTESCVVSEGHISGGGGGQDVMYGQTVVLCLKGISVGGQNVMYGQTAVSEGRICGGQDVMYGQTVVLSEGHICGGSGCNVWTDSFVV